MQQSLAKEVNIPKRYAFGTFAIDAPCILSTLPPLARDAEIDSEITVKWSAAGAPASVTWDHHWTHADTVLLSLARQDGGYWLRVPNYADFFVRLNPGVIQVASSRVSQDSATLEHLLVDQILPRVLAQLGDTVVHASSAQVLQRHVLFLGPSGRGKSTLAGLLHQRGHRILSDDCVQLVALPGGSFGAVPTYPSLRLNTDSLEALFPDQVNTAPVASYSQKRRISMQTPEVGPPVVVDAIYLLGAPAQAIATPRITPISGFETCVSLIKHSFRLDLADRTASALQLQRCSNIARAVPGFCLDYPRDYEQHDALLDALLAHVETLPKPEESLEFARKVSSSPCTVDVG